jgi:quinol monooxygenase YgiN
MSILGRMLIAAAAAVAISQVGIIDVAMPQASAVQPAGTAYVVTYIEVAPSAKGEAAGLLRAIAAASRKEAGNERYNVLQRIGRDNQFAILEAWTDWKAAEAHAEGAALRQFREKLHPLQVSFYDARPSTGISPAPAPAAVSKDAIYAITHVDVTPPFRDACIELLRKLADDTRNDPASLRFEVWQQNNRSNHFTVTEIWPGQSAFDAHIVAAGTREFRAKLGPMSGALYDERLYRIL